MNLLKEGIVTVSNWTMAADGGKYLHFFCREWEIITDADMPIEKFRSSEKWQLIAKVDGVPMGLFPGCQVKGFIAANKVPPGMECYEFGG